MRVIRLVLGRGGGEPGGNRQVDQDPRAPGLLDRDPGTLGSRTAGKADWQDWWTEERTYSSQPDAPGKQGPADFKQLLIIIYIIQEFYIIQSSRIVEKKKTHPAMLDLNTPWARRIVMRKGTLQQFSF